jgi:hypothetical protein
LETSRKPLSNLGSTLALLALAPLLGASLMACEAQDRIGPVRATIDGAGRLHVVTRLKTGQDEGGGWGYRGFRGITQDGGTWSASAVPMEDRSSGGSFGRPYFLAMDGDDRPVVVADAADGVAVFRGGGGDWTELEPAQTLPAEARLALNAPYTLSAAWDAEDGVVRFLAGEWLFEVEGDAILTAREMDTAISLHDRVSFTDCLFDATGPLTGEAACYAWQDDEDDEVHLIALDCTAEPCTWEEVPDVGLGTRDPGGSSDSLRRVFLHLADGTPLLVRPVWPAEGRDTYALLASTPDEDRVLIEGDVYFAGAAARPSGGYAALAATYSDRLLLVIVDSDGALRELDLGRVTASSQEDPLSLLIESSPDGEVAHAFLAKGAGALHHVRVDLTTDHITRKTVGL